MKLELAQFTELEAFAQFASDLDFTTQNQLSRGARLRELLKQSQNYPFTIENQVAIIYAGTNGYLDLYKILTVQKFFQKFLQYLFCRIPRYRNIIRKNKDFDDDIKILLHSALISYQKKLIFYL